MPSRDIRELIEESSLGTPAARALRESVPIEVAQEIVRRASRKRQRGEGLFDWLDRTTHPDAFMHTASGDRDCCRRNRVDSVTETRAHHTGRLVSDFYGKEQ